MRLSFQSFFGLPPLRTPCGRLSLAIFARRLSSILPTWASHSLLRTSVHLTMSWIPLRWRRWSLRNFISKRLAVYCPYSFHFRRSEKLLGAGCFCPRFRCVCQHRAHVGLVDTSLAFCWHIFIGPYNVVEVTGYANRFHCLYPHFLLKISFSRYFNPQVINPLAPELFFLI